MNDIQSIYNTLLSRSFQEELFSELPGRKKQGRETVATCPFCQKAGHFSYSSERPLWKCWSCSSGGDWLKYLMERQRLDFTEALHFLAGKAGIELEGTDQAGWQKYTRRADVLEAAQAIFTKNMDKALKERMGSSQAQAALQYLEARGYTPEDISGMELGANMDRDMLTRELQGQGFTAEEMKDSGLASITEHYPITMLWKDATGRAVGIVGRAILPEPELKAKGLTKYKYSAGMHKDDGMVGFSRVRGNAYVVLVEGVMDALYLTSKGQPVAALGGTALNTTQVKALEQSGTKDILLALDADDRGQQATERTLRLLLASRLRPYIVSMPAGYKDADELVRAEGIDAFKALLPKAEDWPAWTARHVVGKHDTATARGRDSALEEAFQWYEQIEDAISQREYRDSLKQALALSDEELDSRLTAYQKLLSTRRSEASLQATISRLQASAAEGDIVGAEEQLEHALHELRVNRGIVDVEPYLLEDFLADIAATEEGLQTGWQALDNMARIPQGALTLVAGRPRHGKTTMLLNMMANMLRLYPDKQFYFFSYEEARKWLELKLLIRLAGVELDRNFNIEHYINYLRNSRGTNGKIDDALSLLEQYTLEGRLTIMDRHLSAEDLAATLEGLAGKEVGAIFIDYIQKISPRRPAGGGQNWLDIKRVSELVLEQAIGLDVPIILGAQLNRDAGDGRDLRLEYLRESGDLEQDASLVIGLANMAVAQQDKDGQEDNSREADIKVQILKQRTGVSNDVCFLEFCRPIWTMRDK